MLITMWHWDSGTWVGIGLALFFGVAGLASGFWFWWRPRAPKDAKAPENHEMLRVEVSNEFPVFDHPDGSRSVGDHLVGVTARNGSRGAVRATGWGLSIPGNRTIVAPAPTTIWEPRLPLWIQPRDAATWYFDADELRRQAASLETPFDKMVAFVRFADGREIRADRGVPLK